jgi:hypothetical protein
MEPRLVGELVVVSAHMHPRGERGFYRGDGCAWLLLAGEMGNNPIPGSAASGSTKYAVPW